MCSGHPKACIKVTLHLCFNPFKSETSKNLKIIYELIHPRLQRRRKKHTLKEQYTCNPEWSDILEVSHIVWVTYTIQTVNIRSPKSDGTQTCIFFFSFIYPPKHVMGIHYNASSKLMEVPTTCYHWEEKYQYLSGLRLKPTQDCSRRKFQLLYFFSQRKLNLACPHMKCQA